MKEAIIKPISFERTCCESFGSTQVGEDKRDEKFQAQKKTAGNTLKSLWHFSSSLSRTKAKSCSLQFMSIFHRFTKVFEYFNMRGIKCSSLVVKCLKFANESLPVVISKGRYFVHLVFLISFADNWRRLCGLLQQLFVFYFMRNKKKYSRNGRENAWRALRNAKNFWRRTQRGIFLIKHMIKFRASLTQHVHLN